jgi:hypothetical protein
MLKYGLAAVLAAVCAIGVGAAGWGCGAGAGATGAAGPREPPAPKLGCTAGGVGCGFTAGVGVGFGVGVGLPPGAPPPADGRSPDAKFGNAALSMAFFIVCMQRAHLDFGELCTPHQKADSADCLPNAPGGVTIGAGTGAVGVSGLPLSARSRCMLSAR